MPLVKVYHLKPTERIPNSHFPLLYYPSIFAEDCNVGKVYDQVVDNNGWTPQWLFRYGQTQQAHYHSTDHECMIVTSGQATIRFGAADISSDPQENTYASSWEDGGVELHVTAGDAFVIPAGVAHKTFDTAPAAEFALLSPGHGRGIEADDPREAVASLQLDGFTMLGFYAFNHEWDFQTGDTADKTTWSKIWGIPRPKKDPVLGESLEGLCGLWQSSSS